MTDLAHAAGVSSSIVPWSYSGCAYVPYLYQYMVNQCGAKPVSVEDAKPGDIFCDVKSTDWYLEYAMESAEKGLVQGITPVTFGGEYAFTRAMAVTILARMEKPDMNQVPVSSFTDVPKDSYCYDAVNWAAANKIVEGRSADCFDPNSSISRQDFLTIVVRYLEWKGYKLNAQELTYTDMDQIAPYAVPMLQKAQELGLVNGYPEGDFRPEGTMLRRDGVKVLVLLNRYLEANPVPDKDEDTGADAGDASGTDTDDDPDSGTNTDSEPSANVPVE